MDAVTIRKAANTAHELVCGLNAIEARLRSHADEIADLLQAQARLSKQASDLRSMLDREAVKTARKLRRTSQKRPHRKPATRRKVLASSLPKSSSVDTRQPSARARKGVSALKARKEAILDAVFTPL